MLVDFIRNLCIFAAEAAPILLFSDFVHVRYSVQDVDVLLSVLLDVKVSVLDINVLLSVLFDD